MAEITAFCLDVSGSIGERELERAEALLRERARKGDLVVLFDDQARVMPFEGAYLHAQQMRAFKGPVGRGGTDGAEAAKVAREAGASKLVLLSDGMLPDEHVVMFDEFVDLTKDRPRRVQADKVLERLVVLLEQAIDQGDDLYIDDGAKLVGIEPDGTVLVKDFFGVREFKIALEPAQDG